MEKNRIYYKEVMETVLDFGQELLASGAEINRVEDTLSRLGRAFSAEKTDIFVINTSIVATMRFEGEAFTRTRRILDYSGTNFTKIDLLNTLSRKCSEEKLSPVQFRQELEKIKKQKNSCLKICIGGFLAAGAFSLFFGGGLQDALLSAVFGVIIGLLSVYLPEICPNRMLSTFLSALIIGLGIAAVSKIFPVFHADKITIGDIMLLVPGKAITNAARDILLGDTISGAMKLIESLFLTGAMAAGFLLALSLL